MEQRTRRKKKHVETGKKKEEEGGTRNKKRMYEIKCNIQEYENPTREDRRMKVFPQHNTLHTTLTHYCNTEFLTLTPL